VLQVKETKVVTPIGESYTGNINLNNYEIQDEKCKEKEKEVIVA
jgi:hypothetical protein